jgi:hypothetical protein
LRCSENEITVAQIQYNTRSKQTINATLS